MLLSLQEAKERERRKEEKKIENMLNGNDNLVQIITTCVTGEGGNVDRAIGGMVPKDLLNKLYAVYDEIEDFQGQIGRGDTKNRKEHVIVYEEN